MPESVEKLAERLDTLEADLADARDERDRLERRAAEARAGGRDEDADANLAELRESQSRAANLEATVLLVRDDLDHARKRERDAAADRHQREKADEFGNINSTFLDEASELIEAADAFLDRIQPALDLRDEHRAGTVEIDMVDRLFPSVDHPEVEPFPEEEFERLRDRVRQLSARCETLARNYPRDARSGARGIMLERRRGDLFGNEPGMGRVYSRVRGIRGLLSDETREVAEPAIRERLRELYAQIRPERRDKYREPGK